METGRRCVFMDRDGVINRKATPGEYIRTRQEFELIPAAAEWIHMFNALGLLVIVITNQRGVALGRIQPAELDRIHELMRQQLAIGGARIDDIFVCPHGENSCGCRKPKPGLIQAAARKWNISIAGSALIGDSQSDRELAVSCGLRFVPVAHGRILDDLPLTPSTAM
jgi:D-glycero-D-manno-heptose 1,7-bisphosphate phosphatase